MKLQDQVCSLELSKRLKELGVKQESLFYWSFYSSIKEYLLVYGEEHIGELSAFTVAELGEILRKFDIDNDNNLTIDFYNTYDFFNCVLRPTKAILFDSYYIKEEKEVNARAKMLIYLIENKLMEIPE